MLSEIVSELVGADSTTNTEHEAHMAEIIAQMIGRRRYFQTNKAQCGLFEIKQDAFNRKIPWALYRAKGKSKKTVVLTGHLDTVPVENYGLLQQYARNSQQLMEAMAGEQLPAGVREDLESGEWLFGRGTADMKGGLSVFLNELFLTCEAECADINLLFIAVPDEETYSLGMRNAAALLLDLKERYSLDYQLVLMSESHIREDGAALYYDGTIGKMQVNIVVKGVPVHSRYYYTGMNPVLLASQIACDVDGHAELSEQIGSERTPPPSVMYFRDTKTHYDVTLPGSVDMAISILTYRKTGMKVLEQLKDIAEAAVDKVVRQIDGQYAAWSATVPLSPGKYEEKPAVMFYEELLDMAERKDPQKFAAYYTQLKADTEEQLKSHTINFNDATLKMVHSILSYVDLAKSAVILAITPPLYPGFTNSDIASDDSSFILGLPDQVCRFSQDSCGQAAHFDHYFAGISDLSYVATNYSGPERSFINKNMPLWGGAYSIDFDAAAKLQIPVLNVGPWGKNIHTKYERVNKNSLFRECPAVIHWIIETLERQDH